MVLRHRLPRELALVFEQGHEGIEVAGGPPLRGAVLCIRLHVARGTGRRQRVRESNSGSAHSHTRVRMPHGRPHLPVCHPFPPHVRLRHRVDGKGRAQCAAVRRLRLGWRGVRPTCSCFLVVRRRKSPWRHNSSFGSKTQRLFGGGAFSSQSPRFLDR